uniref:Ig-like domain-containing protein n=1 Tax=Biomphalaria glabrata TaxID=6526 RepID=A0A2C9JYX4_BIOGL
MKRVLTDLSIMTLFWISVLSTSPVKHKNLSVTPCSNPDNLTNYCDIYRYRKTRIICTFTALQGLQMTWKYTPFNMKVETTVGNSSRGVQTTSSPCLCGDNYWNYTSTLVIANSDSAQGNTAIRCLGTVNNTTQEVVMKIGASYERIALPEEVFQDNSFTLQCLKTSFKMEENTTLIKEFRLEKYNSTSDKYEVILVHSPKFKNCSASSWQLCQENGTIGLVRNKTNAVCSDAGLYRCSAITSKNITFISPSEYLRVLDRPRILAYKIVPCESIGCSNVTLVCVAKGPLLMHINWLFPRSKWDESAKQFTAALGQSDCGDKLYMVTSNISLPEKHLHDLPTCSVAYEDEFTSYDQRSSELDDEDTMVKNIILEYQSHLIINCTQKWFHLTNFSMTTLSVAKQNSDGHREERARINLDSNKSLVTTATNWSANQTQIYGNVALQVTKVNVTCLDDGLYLCLATFYHNQTKAHQELFQSFLIDVVDRRVETNQPLIQTKQCPSQQVCCVEQNQTINVT